MPLGAWSQARAYAGLTSKVTWLCLSSLDVVTASDTSVAFRYIGTIPGNEDAEQGRSPSNMRLVGTAVDSSSKVFS